MHYAPGDIVIIMFPFSDLTGAKARPAIVVSNSIVNKTSDIILAQITSTIHSDNLSFPLVKTSLKKPLEDNRQCEIRCHKVFCAEKAMVKKKISALTDEKVKELQQKMITLFDREVATS